MSVPVYGALAAEHLRNPRNLGKLTDADGVGQVERLDTDTLLIIYLKLDPGRQTIQETQFRAFGCGGCIVTGSVLTELVRGRSLAEAHALDGVAIIRAVEDGLPAEQRYCADLAVEALQKAIEAARV